MRVTVSKSGIEVENNQMSVVKYVLVTPTRCTVIYSLLGRVRRFEAVMDDDFSSDFTFTAVCDEVAVIISGIDYDQSNVVYIACFKNGLEVECWELSFYDELIKNIVLESLLAGRVVMYGRVER